MADAEREAYARALAERRRQVPSVDEEDESRTNKAIALRRECRSIGGSEAEEYLRGRCITVELPSCLRFHPRLYCDGDYWPALVADITDINGRVIGVHRTFLAPGGSGKAPIANPKRALGRVAGGAVRLRMPIADTCGVAEGIETALSAQQLFKLPVFAACGCNLAGVISAERPHGGDLRRSRRTRRAGCARWVHRFSRARSEGARAVAAGAGERLER